MSILPHGAMRLGMFSLVSEGLRRRVMYRYDTGIQHLLDLSVHRHFIPNERLVVPARYRTAYGAAQESETHMIGSSSTWREREHGESMGFIRSFGSLWHQWALGSNHAVSERG